MLILPDAITSFYEAGTFVDCVLFFKRIGYEPIVTPFIENGKGQNVKGILQAFSKQPAVRPGNSMPCRPWDARSSALTPLLP